MRRIDSWSRGGPREASVCLIFVLVCVVPGCRRDPPDRDAGVRDAGSSRDAGMAPDAATDAPEPEVDVAGVVEALDHATTIAALVAGPLVSDAAMVDAMGDGASDATIRERVEDGVATNSIVDDASCVAFDWTLRTATITFTGCTSETTGLSIEGAVTFAVTFRPTTFTVTFTDLTIDGTRIAGELSLAVAGDAGARTFTVGADLAWTRSGTASSVVLTGVRVTTDATAMTTTLEGAFSLSTGSTSASGTLDALTWALGDCHPSSGSATFVVDAGRPTIVTFLPTTPATGIVSVQVPPLPAVSMMLLAPCG